jgi:hypothetical protein
MHAAALLEQQDVWKVFHNSYVTDPPSYCALLTSGGRLIGLTLYACDDDGQ